MTRSLILLLSFGLSQFVVAQTANDSETLSQNLGRTLENQIDLSISSLEVDQLVEAIEALPFSSQSLYQATGVLNFRESTNPSSRILDQIPEGFGALMIVEKSGQRALVRYCRKEGWVSLNFLRKQAPNEARKQNCGGRSYDPFPIADVSDEVEDINIDSTLTVGDNQRIDATQLGRDLGQATLSPAYSVCLSDAGSDQQKQSKCLEVEQQNWHQDMNIAFNLVASTLPFQQMKLLRDSQRIWTEQQKKLCVDLGIEEAEPFSRYHIPTCKLKMTFQRAIGLETLLQSDVEEFEQRLVELDVPLAPE